MKKNELLTLDIRNFKGIEHEEITFSNRVEIRGRNGTGKTTVLDAFLWCLFGKDSSGASDFSVKPKKADGTDIQHIDVDVLSTLCVDGITKTFRRRLVEKWSTPRGAKEPEFKGHEGEYFMDDVPLKASDYAAEISKVCEEALFKMITTAGAFNKLKDADRRRVLSMMADQVSDIELATDFPNVLQALNDGKTIDRYKDEIKSKKKRIADEKEQYPARLKENADMRPQLLDFAALRTQETEISAKIDKLVKPLSDVAESPAPDPVAEFNAQMDEVSKTLNADRDKKLNLLNEVLAEQKRRRKSIEENITDATSRLRTKEIQEHEQTMVVIREDWAKENARTVEVSVDSKCPTCETPYTPVAIATKRNEIIQNFNKAKLGRLEEIKKRGDSESEYIAKLKKTNEEVEAELTEYRAKLEAIKKDVSDTQKKIDDLPTLQLLCEANIEYCNLRTKRDNLKAAQAPTAVETAQMVDPKAELDKMLTNVRKELAKEDEIKRCDQRKEELMKRQNELGQEIASLEAIEHEILQFSMKKTDLIESSVASKFKFVRFKLFDYNITNDGAREVCICTVNGVPYPDLNTAMQINADIDIINALSAHYGVSAPVFIDRAESVNQIEETAGQRIDLYATKDDMTLKVIQK